MCFCKKNKALLRVSFEKTVYESAIRIKRLLAKHWTERKANLILGKAKYKCKSCRLTQTTNMCHADYSKTSLYRTGFNGSIYPRFEISHIHLFALIDYRCSIKPEVRNTEVRCTKVLRHLTHQLQAKQVHKSQVGFSTKKFGIKKGWSEGSVQKNALYTIHDKLGAFCGQLNSFWIYSFLLIKLQRPKNP